jgi:cbb3-type cytochrome oxidase maturation protein
MSVVILLLLASLAVGLIFVGAFVWAVRGGQYEDTLTPAMRVLLDDATPPKNLPQAGGQTAPCPASDKTTLGRKQTLK